MRSAPWWILVVLLGMVACDRPLIDDDLGDDDATGTPGRGLTPITGDLSLFSSVRAPDGTYFLSGYTADMDHIEMVRIAPDGTVDRDGVLYDAGSTPLAPGWLGADASGRVCWLWGETTSSGQTRMMERCHTPGQGWGAQVVIEDDPVLVSGEFYPNFASDGTITVVWDSTNDVWATVDQGGGWSAPQQLDPPDVNFETHIADQALFAGVEDGRGLAIWDEAGVGLQAASYQPGMGWTGTAIPGGPTGLFDLVALDYGSGDEAIVLWTENGSLHALVSDGGSWAPDTVVDTGVENPVAKAASLGGGAFAALWTRGSPDPELRLGRRDGSTWTVGSQPGLVGGLAFDLLATQGGEAVALFATLDPMTLTYSVQASRSAPSGFGSPVALAPPWIDLPWTLRLHQAAGGTVQALWSEASIVSDGGGVYLVTVP